MAFNSADTAAFKNVWVFCEQRQGKMMPTTFELISEGRKLADELGVELCGILLGDNVDGIAKELGGYGADKVYVYNSPLLKDYTTDAYTKVITDAVEEIKPEILLFGASNIGRDLAPRCAARLHTGLCADCTHLDIDMPIYKNFLREASTLAEERIEKLGTVKINGQDHDVSRDIKMTRPAFGGHLMASIFCPRFRPAMATVRPGVMKKREFCADCAEKVEILHPAFELSASDIKTEVVETVKAAKKLVDLIGADFIVSVASARMSRAASSWLRSWPRFWAASWAPPVPAWTPAGSPLTIRSARPVRPSIPRSTSPWVSPAPSSTRLVCRTPSASSP